MRVSSSSPALLPLLVAIACTPQVQSTSRTPARTDLPTSPAGASGADWASYNGSPEGTRYSALAEITPANAASVQRACTFDTGEQMSMQSGPVVVDGVLYLTTDTSTYAIDAATCRRIWNNDR